MLRVLRDLELLGTLTWVGTVPGTIASHDAHLDGALGHMWSGGLLDTFLLGVDNNKQKTTFARILF